MSRFSLTYYDPLGGYVCKIDKFIHLEYGRTENDIGSLVLEVPQIYVNGFFKVDGRLEVMVKESDFSAEYRDGDTVYFIRQVITKVDEQRKRYIHILAYDTISLLNRRIIAYKAGSSQSTKTGTADYIIKQIMRDNFGDLATDTARDLSAWLSIEDYATGKSSVSMTKSFAWQIVLSAIQEICNESRDTNNEYLCFDIVPYNDIFQFRTYAGQRGANRGIGSYKPITFNYDDLSLSYASIAFDSSTEKNYIYAGGQGQEDKRLVMVAKDDGRINLSPFNRIEDFYSCVNSATEAAVQSEANAQLAKMASAIKFNGHIVQRTNLLFGVHYNFGDIAVASIEGYTFDVHLSGFTRTVEENGAVATSIMARNLDSSEY